MNIIVKSQNEEDGEIETWRNKDGSLGICITNSHASTHYTMDKEEVEGLIAFIKLTNERLDKIT